MKNNTATGENAFSPREIAFRELISRFRDDVNALFLDPSENAGQMQLSGDTLSASNASLSSQIEAAEAAAGEISRNLESIIALAETLSASIEEEEQLVARTSGVVNEATDAANSTDRKITELSESAEAIGNVVSLIGDIAKQSNLLALNATIEAVRAGENGKSFAVVASEVKQLANRTREATETIRAQIASIQTATRDAVGSIHDISEKMKDANTSTMTIASAVEHQRAATNEIFQSMRNATAEAGNANKIISGLSVEAGETTRLTDRALSASHESSAREAKLRRAVEDFLDRAEAS